MLQSIYLIGDNNGNYKIGISHNPSQRKSTLNAGTFDELRIYHQSDAISNASKIERDIHSFYKKHHIRGEWFHFNDCELDKVINFIDLCVDENGIINEESNHFAEEDKKILAWMITGECLSLKEIVEKTQEIKQNTVLFKKENKRQEDFRRFLNGDGKYNDTDYARLYNKYPFDNTLMLICILINLGWIYDDIEPFVKQQIAC